jgi:hypothetical protein
MKTDLQNAVNKYKKNSIYHAINEAIVNSIQANASKIVVKIVPTNDADLYGQCCLSSVSIEDDGDGFNEVNRKSFLTYLSRHKQEQGCQGIGRLSYLKSFEKVHILSKQNKERVDFDFTTELDETKIQPKSIEDETKKTIITLEKPIDDIKYDLDKTYQEIYNHIYPFLFLRTKDCEIIINDDYKKITRDDVKNIQVEKFVVNEKDQPINLALFYRFEKSDKAILDDFLCINSRPMKCFKHKPLGIKLNKKEGYHITFLLESDWFNKQSNSFHNIDIEEDVEEEIQESLFKDKDVKKEWSDVKNKVEQILNELLNKEFPELEKENAKKISDLKEKYLHYADYIESSNVGFVTEKKILDNAYEKMRDQEEKVINSSNPSEEDINKCVNTSLIAYILHRQKIIEKLQELKHTEIEEKIHNLFLEKGLEGYEERQVPLDKNNLWLLDDKFMSYNYIASEKAISTFLNCAGLEKNSSNEEMDIVLYSNSQEKQKAVIVELKKLTANYKENGTGINQLFNYSAQLYDAGIKELYLYLIAEIDDKFRRQLVSKEGFKKIFSHEGEVYQRSYDDNNAYIQIISPNVIIADAAARNKTFLKIIKNSKKIREV